MAQSRQIKIAVVGDASQLSREMEKARASMGDFGVAADRAKNSLTSFLVGGAAIVGAQKLIKAAADLEQSVGGTAAVFRNASGEIDEFAKSAANLAGLSENAARTLTSRLGAGLISVGFTTKEAAKQAIFLTQTGADLAATLGGTTEEAVTALAATLRGEYDPIERYIGGLKASTVAAKAVSMGLAKTENDVSSYAKAQATLALITENSAFAQGQYNRELDTAAGAAQTAKANSEDAAASLGKSLLPIYTKMAEVVGAVAKAFAALPAPVQTSIVAIAAIAAVARPVQVAFTAMGDLMRALNAAFNKSVESMVTYGGAVTSIGKTQETLAKGTPPVASAFSGLSLALGAVGIALTAATILFTIYNGEQERVKKNAKEFKKTLDENTGSITANTTALFRQNLEENNRLDNLSRANITVEEYTRAIADNTGELSSSVKALALEGIIARDSEKARKNLADKIREENTARTDLIATLIQNGALDSGLLNQIIDNTKASEVNAKAIRDKATQSALSAGASRDEAKSAGDAAIENKRQADATAELNEQLRKKIDLLFESASGQIALEQSGIAARKAIEDFNQTQRDGSKSADERRAAELNAQEAILRVGQAAVKAAEDQKGSALTAAEAQAVQIFQLANLANSLAPDSPLRKYIEEYIKKLNEIPANKPTTITADTSQAENQIKNLRERLLDLIRIPNAPRPSFMIEDRWTGGDVNKNKPYLVGEKGPELFVPSSYGRIMNTFSTNKAMNSAMTGGGTFAGQSVNVTINTVTGDAIEIERVVIDAIARANRRGMTTLTP